MMMHKIGYRGLAWTLQRKPARQEINQHCLDILVICNTDCRQTANKPLFAGQWLCGCHSCNGIIDLLGYTCSMRQLVTKAVYLPHAHATQFYNMDVQVWAWGIGRVLFFPLASMVAVPWINWASIVISHLQHWWVEWDPLHCAARSLVVPPL